LRVRVRFQPHDIDPDKLSIVRNGQFYFDRKIGCFDSLLLKRLDKLRPPAVPVDFIVLMILPSAIDPYSAFQSY